MIRLEVMADEERLADRAAVLIRGAAERAVASRGRFEWAVSGGTTPLRALHRLVLPWNRTATLQVDERLAPEGHPERNLTRLRDALGSDGSATLRPMPVDAADLESAAAGYATDLPERFDLVQLGIGEDGHTASLVPGDPVLEVRDRDVALTGEYRGWRRLTLTYAAINRAHEVLWLVAGAGKADALARLLAGDRSIPAGRVTVPRQVVLADGAAALHRSRSEPEAPR